MKKTLLSLSFALALAAGASTAIAQDTNANGAGGFVGATVGSAHWKADGSTANRFAYGVSGGYRWSLDANQSLGAEIGYTDFGTLHDRSAFASNSLDADAYTLGANYRYAFDNGEVNRYFLQARGGYLRWNAKDRLNVYGVGRSSDTEHGNGWYAGVGVGRNLGDNVSLTLNYDFHRANASNDHVNFGVASIGAQYRF